MERWTIKELNNTSDIDFAISILNERRNGLTNPYSPISRKLDKAMQTLESVQNGSAFPDSKPEMGSKRTAIFDFIQFEDATSKAWPWAMPAAEILQDEAILSTLEKTVTFDESGNCDTESLYEAIDKLVGVNPAFGGKPEGKQDTKTSESGAHQSNNLAGGYILVSTYATLTDEEAKALRDTDETPTAVIAVKKDWLEAWIKPEYATLEEFLDDYTFDTIANLSAEAELEGELAFEYRDGLDDPFLFPNGCSGDAMLAFVDFLSGKLQENGHEEASKYLDCHDELAFEYRDGLDDSFLFSKGCSGDAMLAFADFLSGKLQENGHEEASKYLDCLLSL